MNILVFYNYVFTYAAFKIICSVSNPSDTDD